MVAEALFREEASAEIALYDFLKINESSEIARSTNLELTTIASGQPYREKGSGTAKFRFLLFHPSRTRRIISANSAS